MKVLRPMLHLVFSRRSFTERAAISAGHAIDERLDIASGMRRQLNKVFPDNWSFMLGEIALYAFVLLLLTGTYLTFFFSASSTEVRYDGRYVPLDGVSMSKAYESTLHISFDVRGGLLVRQMHHWAALLFVAAIVVHLGRIFFTGAYRKPREINWLIGLTMFALAVVEGFAGYSLPDDLLSGTGLRVAQAIMLSIPVVGTLVAYLIFGAKFPGTEIIGRLYIAHVLLIPGLLAVLIAVHLAIVVRQKHTDFPSAGKTERTVVGERIYPLYAAKTVGFFLILCGTLGGLGGLAQINPVWLYGPYSAARIANPAQPDWYMLLPEGAIRIFPAWEIRAGGHTVSPLLWPAAMLPALMFLITALWPFLEARATRDHQHHNLLQRPRDAPVRTGVGAATGTFVLLLTLAGADDVVARVFKVDIETLVWFFRIGVLVLPPVIGWLTYWFCLGLAAHDRSVLREGIPTGVVTMTEEGDYVEQHQPLGPVDEEGLGVLTYAQSRVPHHANEVLRTSPPRGFFRPPRNRR